MKILVADDDFANRKLLEKVLDKYGEVTLVDNGMSAVESVVGSMDSDSPYELICLDIMMSKLDGYRTLETIREAENKRGIIMDKRATVIMISALDEVVLDDIQVCNDYDAYICKPILIPKFEKLLDKMGFARKPVA